MIGGYLVALLTASNTPLRRFTRTVVFVPVVIGLGASSLLWYWLFSPGTASSTGSCMDLGIIDEPILWLGTDASLVELGGDHLGRLEGARLRHDPVRRRDPGDPHRDQRGGDGRRRQRLAAHDRG